MWRGHAKGEFVIYRLYSWPFSRRVVWNKGEPFASTCRLRSDTWFRRIFFPAMLLTHWDRVTHIGVGKLTIIDSDNGLSPGRRQVFIWTNAGILLIRPLGTNFSEILIGIQIFSFKKMYLKMSSAKWRPICLGLNRLNFRIYFYELTD